MDGDTQASEKVGKQEKKEMCFGGNRGRMERGVVVGGLGEDEGRPG